MGGAISEPEYAMTGSPQPIPAMVLPRRDEIPLHRQTLKPGSEFCFAHFGMATEDGEVESSEGLRCKPNCNENRFSLPNTWWPHAMLKTQRRIPEAADAARTQSIVG